jgi:enoyl-CoA hydratase/carnithine racemase
MILTGESIDARQALDYGLVQWVVPQDALEGKAEEVARRLITRPVEAVRRAKEAIVRGLDMGLDEAIRMEWRLGLALKAS